MTTLAGHGKDPRLVQAELPIIPNVGDRVQIDSKITFKGEEVFSYQGEGTFVRTGKLLKDWWKVEIKDKGKTLIKDFEAKDCKIINSLPEQSFKVGDRIKDKDGFIGVITSISDHCINAENNEYIKSWNLEECLITSIGLEAAEPSVMQQGSPARSKQSGIQTSAKTHKRSTVQTSLKSQSLEISEISPHPQESICLQGDFHAQEPQTLVQGKGLNIQNPRSGLNISELSTKDNPDLLSLKTPHQLSITDYEQYLEDSEWLDIVGMIRKSYKLLSSEVPKNGKDFLSLPTLTTNKGVKSRSSGQSKCEKWFRDKGLLQDTQCLSPQMMAVLFGFPMDWTKCLWDAQEEVREESDQDISLGEPSTLTVVQQSLNESCTSIAASTPDKAVLVENISSPGKRLAYLLSKRDRLIASGASPKGVWLCSGKVPNRDFIQVVWKADKPHPWLGGAKSRYIGKLNSDEHLSAIAQHRAGQELRKIEREIKSIQKELVN